MTNSSKCAKNYWVLWQKTWIPGLYSPVLRIEKTNDCIEAAKCMTHDYNRRWYIIDLQKQANELYKRGLLKLHSEVRDFAVVEWQLINCSHPNSARKILFYWIY